VFDRWKRHVPWWTYQDVENMAHQNGLTVMRRGNIRIDEITGKTYLAAPIVPKHFDVSIIKPDYTVVLFGRRGAGKSFLIQHIMYSMRHIFTCGLVFTRTAHNGFYQQMVPESYIHEELDDVIIEKFMKIQAQKVQQANLEDPDMSRNLWSFIIFDDTVDQGTRYHAILDKLFYLGRHFQCFIMIASQWVTGKCSILLSCYISRSLAERLALMVPASATRTIIQRLLGGSS
jgi:hypothetical protein